MTIVKIIFSFILFFAGNVIASDYPTRPITIVLGMPAGSTFPIISNIVTNGVENSRFKFVNTYRVGQGNLLAYQHLRNSSADGYTVGFVTTSLVVNPFLYKDSQYNPVEDFELIASIGVIDNGIISSNRVPFVTVKDIVRYGKANPNKLLYGHNGFATQSFLAIELLAAKHSVMLTGVPYKDSGFAFVDLISGSIDFHLTSVLRIQSLAQSDKIKIIATTGQTRSRLFPTTPTVGETYHGYYSNVWYAFVVRKQVPEDIKRQLAAVFNQSLRSENVQRHLDKFAIVPNQISADRLIMTEYAKWGNLIKTRNIVAQ